MNTSEIEARVERLERANRRLNRGGSLKEEPMREIRPKLLSVLIALVAFTCAVSYAQEKGPTELNTLLMESTFKIEGLGSLGTAFVLGRPFPNEPSKARYVLVTAAHVLEDIKGDTAVIHLRFRQGPSQWSRLPYPIQIRDGQHPLWLKHPQADVAVMYIRVPKDVAIPLRSVALLADDRMLAQFEIHPGDELKCLGYPFGAESSPAGFPILRSGKISSYPLIPTSDIKTFLFDFRIFSGNSGGPVYFVESNRTYGGSTHLGQTIQFIVGLVSQEQVLKQPIAEPYVKGERQYQLGLAQVVHASLIKQAIDLLPSPDSIPD